jgi:GntR family transcriptional regulator
MAHNFPFQRLQADLAKIINKTSPGKRLPTEPELAKQLGVSRATLREAMRSFETQGLLRRKQGSGTYVVGKIKALDSGLEVLESLDTVAKKQGLSISFSNLTIESLQANEDQAAMFKMKEGGGLTRIRRIIRAEDRPIAYLVDTLPETLLPAKEFPKDFNGSVLDFLLGRGDVLTSSRADVSAIDSSAEIAKLLEIQRGDVLLYFNAQLFNEHGKVVDHSLSYFIPGYFHFHIVRRVGNSN